jgi:hypothetical protein
LHCYLGLGCLELDKELRALIDGIGTGRENKDAKKHKAWCYAKYAWWAFSTRIELRGHPTVYDERISATTKVRGTASNFGISPYSK